MKKRVAISLLVVSMLVVAVPSYEYDVWTKVQFIGNSRSEAVFYLFQKLRKDGLIATINAVREKLTNDPRLGLGYSLYDKAAAPQVESAAAREALPEFKIIRAADSASLPPSRATASKFDTWYRSNGDDGSSKYSALNQIDIADVPKLQLAWRYSNESRNRDESMRVESNPVVANGRLFLASIDSNFLSLDAATGRELWRTPLPGPVARRGVVWEPNADFAASRIFVPTARGVYALRAATGEVIKDFGNAGQVGDQLSLIAPVLADDKLVVTLVKPSIEAYDRQTGKLLWATPLLEPPVGPNTLLTGGSPWAGMSYDASRSLVFVSTGNPRPELWGVSRPGPNKHSSSVVAIDTKSGRIAWAFQEIEHDLWDLDVPSPPVLATITKDGRRIDVVATVTKMGNTLLLDRDRGTPIFDYRLRRAPASLVPGEQTAAYQPDLELPEPILKQVFEPADVTDVSEEANTLVGQKVRSATLGFFQPPVLGGSVVVFGLGGGASWPGAAVDPATGVLFIPSSQAPWIVRANYRDLRAASRATAGVPGNNEYQSLCANCHGSTRDGLQDKRENGGRYYPSLTGITLLRSRDVLTSKTEFTEQHVGVKVDVDAAGKALPALFTYFARLDKMVDDDKAFAVRTFWGLLEDQDGYPGSKPPWGMLTALDMSTGKKLWQVPFGEYQELKREGKPVQGQVNIGGAIVTAGGLVFATGTPDKRIRAFESRSGRELWSASMSAPGTAPPTTYMLNGRQYIAVVASSDSHQEVLAFALPQ